MATQIEKQPKDLREPKMNPLAVTLPGKAPEAGSVRAVEVEIYVTNPQPPGRLLLRMARTLVSFYECISGPAMSKRERDERAIAQWEFDRKHDRYLYL
jgi:hypothetical protein